MIFYFDLAGNKYVASGGSLAWRINNPGLVRSRSHFSYRNGAIGNCESYAIFADATCGRKALVSWLHSKKYFKSSLLALEKHYNPKDPGKLLCIFTFGGGSYIEPVKCHPDSHNYASAADFVCRLVSPNQQWLALQRYYGHKDGLNDAQVIYKLAFEDATLHLDTTDVKVWEIFIKKRERHYEQEFSKINHITILDPDPDSNNWKHEFISDCYKGM